MTNLKAASPEVLARFDEHAVAIAKRQYFQPGDEDVLGMFRRVAAWVASPEAEGERSRYEARFYDLMVSKRFCPGGRVLAGAATGHGNVLNCFVQDGSPEVVGTDAWVIRLATKLALVTKVGGGNGLCLDPLPPKRPFTRPVGKLYLTISPAHPDYAKVKTGTYMDLVHGKYTTKGYRCAQFLEPDEVPSALHVTAVGDSVESIWQSAGESVTKLLAGEDVLLDLSKLRAEGTPVKGSGGNSSGPSSFAVEVFDNFALWASLGGAAHAGPVATLRYIFAPTLRVIRQGGTRRGAGMATLSVTHPDIEDFITCKDLSREQTEGDISTFNISVLVSDAFMERAKRTLSSGVLQDIADHAWQTGEPGLIFIDRINAFNPMRESLGEIKATNPCVTADTWVLTQLGARRVGDLVGKKFCAVVDGKAYGLTSQGFWSTGVKPVFKLRTKRGFELRLTGNHKLKKVLRQTRYVQDAVWAELESLKVGDRILLSNHRGVAPWAGPGTFAEGWLLGALIGDGTFAEDKRRACLDFWGESRATMTELATAMLRHLFGANTSLWVTQTAEKTRIASDDLYELAARYGLRPGYKTLTDALEEGSFDLICGLLCGLFDTDGSVQGNQDKGFSVRLAQSDAELLVRAQRMLARLGIVSTRYENRRPEGWRTLPDGNGGSRAYRCRAEHELVISCDNLAVFAALVGFEEPAKRQRLTAHLNGEHKALDRERFSDEIVSISPDGEEEVFDVTVEHVHAFDANGLLAHNCGEIPLFPGEPCDLGAINLAAYVTGEGLENFAWDAFREDVRTCVRFLDNVLEVNRFALEDNRAMSMKLRRLGLGIMGLADALIKLGYRYDTDEGRAAVEAIITAMRESATEASRALAEERGAFPEFGKSSLKTPRRNVALLTVAPTGTTSMLMGVSSGVEPIFAPFIYRKIGDTYAALIAPLFKEMLEQHPPHPDYEHEGAWDWERVVEAVQANHGSVQGLAFIPEAVKRVLVCAHDIAPEDHVKMQGAVQRAFDAGGEMVANSISKTINLPNKATVADVYSAYSMAFDVGCKGITVYRDGSRQFQVLSTSKGASEKQDAATPPAPARPERLPGEPLFDRPARLVGFTDNVKLTMSNGEKRSFYITVNTQDGLPTEVFIQSGKGGEEIMADSEALGRLVSIALQYGVPAEAIVKTLRGINGGMYGSYQGRMVASKADLIAVALETAGVENPLHADLRCPEGCGGTLVREEGCYKCYTCGYSKCG
ncbi:intein-containing adenosylcobalamin-dependent ribonucleoside-diphosphate reductase [Truepera radiovictrix]|uniref:Ribonucleoside-diphosphate reductase n=1 Tax=Truepera radiovictrix (strain DSM 17093 / CIP 108686 / LMG 22925 / RQ-24) TaxID=649638 RepID=D7CX96_TRURR|nr:intein-containing adenosylcobalamin-dependent ribonucleoside-diphosphate reductase [Truepera radiovictrix]ADI13220.1 ribonucleoside-diphosphate reductase, adenosylcobalamin-dependent [Truepera radiovictrix DSM 17093]WMT58215.1 intein-containing adenosylcobalamin-dependent ribonucleoside-diphosphate reductase [Truepera radiovictrix]